MLKYTAAEKRARALKHEAGIAAGMRQGWAFSYIAASLNCDQRVLAEDFEALGIDREAYMRERLLRRCEAKGREAVEAARARAEERESPLDDGEARQTRAEAKAACAAHFHDLVAAYPGRKLASLNIPEGYGGYRPVTPTALPLRASVANSCAEWAG